MTEAGKTNFNFPVGYHRFHKNQLFNYQLNRPYAFGYAEYEDLRWAGSRISDFATWKSEMTACAEKALSEGRLINAAFYYRAAEFYTSSQDPDKERLYDTFSELFYSAIAGDPLEKASVPYGNVSLPAIKLAPAAVSKGTIVLHGGFDSFIEELYSMMRYFSDHGYEVIGFEGPGQGAALKKHGLALDYKWEKPVKAVLDYFDRDDVTLIGISMGGYFCLRAAAFESRVKRVIADGHAIDYWKIPPPVAQWLMKFFYTHLRDYTNRSMEKALKKGSMESWTIANLMYIAKLSRPIEVLDFSMQLNENNLHSELVKQDVLLLSSEGDHFIPIKMHGKQVRALINARSVTDRIFRKNEDAHNHCQIGNVGLALEVMRTWIDSMT
ncbi:MAG: alpha/beta fold hydrolase [Spirochaetes bacterium]|nr:alpha/beta fold hydrolase [Spirochaetota bacterium]